MSTPPCSHVTITKLVVRPRDMDADRNVNNAVYFEYFHQSRLEHLARLGVWQPRGSGDNNLFALAENTCRYLAPSFYGDLDRNARCWAKQLPVGLSNLASERRRIDRCFAFRVSVGRWAPAAYIAAASWAQGTYRLSLYRPAKDARPRLGEFAISSGWA